MEITTHTAPDVRLTVKRYLVLCDDVVMESCDSYAKAWESFSLLKGYGIGNKVTLAPVAYDYKKGDNL